MNQGDVVVCRDSRCYAFTEGKEYTILKYEPADCESTPGFTWPAYVMVEDDYGRNVMCHASRFIPKEPT